ncbi:MAG: tripartite tricarboxylate transporter substrate binding protein [Betaproteobacteria bacterium]|nr:tripartite tricarboxylate transporter substrate binding protein [Betaproteobacteria bacterium]
MKNRAAWVLCGMMLSFIGAAFAADEWPNKPVRIVVPAPAGGGTADPISRVIADELGKAIGPRFIVENHPGANGNIGATVAAKAAPDGYTLLFSWAGTLATNVSLYSKMPIDPRRDLMPIVLVGNVPNILVVNNDLPARTLAEFTSYAKANPGKLNFGSTGNGSSMHLSGELYRKLTETTLVHVPYNAPGTATTDLMSGRIQVMFQLITGIAQQVKAGRVRAIAVLSPKRSPVLPDVPTSAEFGLPGLESGTWFGLLAPNGTPAAVLARVNAETNRLLENVQVRQRLMEMGLDPAGGTPQQFATFWDEEIRRWASIVKFSGARLD